VRAVLRIERDRVKGQPACPRKQIRGGQLTPGIQWKMGTDQIMCAVRDELGGGGQGGNQ
jgi:hypothetical protein